MQKLRSFGFILIGAVAGILVAMLVPVRPRLAASEFLARASAGLDALRASALTRDSVLGNEAQLDALVALDDAATDMRPPGLTLERFLHPLQAFVILPLFAFFNAGVSLGGRGLAVLADPVTHDGNGLRNILSRVDEIGGTVKIESAPGRGTRIVLRIPCPPRESPP